MPTAAAAATTITTTYARESYKAKAEAETKPSESYRIVLLHSTHSVILIQFDDEPSTEVNTMRNANAFITHFHRNFSPLHSK